jgi:hypothetical protein
MSGAFSTASKLRAPHRAHCLISTHAIQKTGAVVNRVAGLLDCPSQPQQRSQLGASLIHRAGRKPTKPAADGGDVDGRKLVQPEDGSHLQAGLPVLLKLRIEDQIGWEDCGWNDGRDVGDEDLVGRRDLWCQQQNRTGVTEKWGQVLKVVRMAWMTLATRRSGCSRVT